MAISSASLFPMATHVGAPVTAESVLDWLARLKENFGITRADVTRVTRISPTAALNFRACAATIPVGGVRVSTDGGASVVGLWDARGIVYGFSNA